MVDKNDLEAVRVSDEVLQVNTPNKHNMEGVTIESLNNSVSNLKDRSSKAKSTSQINLKIDTSFNGLNKLDTHGSYSNLKAEVSMGGGISKLLKNNDISSTKLNEYLDVPTIEKDDSDSNVELNPPQLNFDNITFEEYLNQPVPPTPLRLSITSQFWETRSPNPNANTSIINMPLRPRGFALNVDTLIDHEYGVGMGYSDDESDNSNEETFYNDIKKENDVKNNKKLQFKRLLMAQEIEKTRIRLNSISNVDYRVPNIEKGQIQNNQKVNTSDNKLMNNNNNYNNYNNNSSSNNKSSSSNNNNNNNNNTNNNNNNNTNINNNANINNSKTINNNTNNNNTNNNNFNTSKTVNSNTNNVNNNNSKTVNSNNKNQNNEFNKYSNSKGIKNNVNKSNNKSISINDKNNNTTIINPFTNNITNNTANNDVKRFLDRKNIPNVKNIFKSINITNKLISSISQSHNPSQNGSISSNNSKKNSNNTNNNSNVHSNGKNNINSNDSKNNRVFENSKKEINNPSEMTKNPDDKNQKGKEIDEKSKYS